MTNTARATLAPQHAEHLGWTSRADAEAALALRPRSVLLALVDDDATGWVEADEADELGAKVLVWGVASASGVSMLTDRNTWCVVA